MADMQDTIIIKAPPGTKARWVRASQREGKKLSDWINERVEQSMHKKTAAIVIPADVAFADLKMTRDPKTGDVAFDWAPLERICTASGVDIGLLRDQPEDNVGGLITTWYRQHIAAGGQPDLVMHDLIGESQIEDAHGHGFSHKPGAS
jgi:hypothetical protein